jgi:hypothetical protein
LVMLCILSGCQPTHLLYVNNSTLGIDVAVSPENTARMVFGYDRDTFALVPRKDDESGSEAMSLASVGCIYAEGLSTVRFNQFVATGSAAKQIATDSNGVKAIRDAIYGGSKPCGQ